MHAQRFSHAQLLDLAQHATVTALFRAADARYWVNLVTKEHDIPVAETHDHEADLYLVVEGDADLYLGGTLLNPHAPEPGQQRGTGLDGATRNHITAGDFIVIPAGVPHMVDARAGRIVYLVIKEDADAR